MNVSVAFTVTADGEIKMQNAEIRDAVSSPLHVSRSNLYDPRKESLEDFVVRQKAQEAPAVRFMIQLRDPDTGHWKSTGMAVEQYVEEGQTKTRPSIDAGHFASILEERTARIDPSVDKVFI